MQKLVEENEKLKAVIRHCFSYDFEEHDAGNFPIGISLTFPDGLDAVTVKRVLLEETDQS